MGKVVTRDWWNVKVLSWNFHSFRLLEIIQVLDSMSWVRCASGNVFFNILTDLFSMIYWGAPSPLKGRFSKRTWVSRVLD